MLNYNKKAQISTTMTWLVATIIIIIAISFFLFFTNILASKGAIENSISSAFSSVEFDLNKWTDAKTEIAFRIKQENSEKINNWIMESKK